MLACQLQDPIPQQEGAYMEAFQGSVSHRVAGGRLELAHGAGQTTLVFAAAGTGAMDPGELRGSQWRLLSMDGNPAAEGSTITLAFHEGNRTSGHAGCRDYVITYEASEDESRFPFVVMLGEPCPEAIAVAAQEEQ
jgi:heat shock protein HslJ